MDAAGKMWGSHTSSSRPICTVLCEAYTSHVFELYTRNWGFSNIYFWLLFPTKDTYVYPCHCVLTIAPSTRVNTNRNASFDGIYHNCNVLHDGDSSITS